MVDFSIYNRDDDSLADIDYMGHGRDGGYAEYQAVPAENAHVVDTDLSDVELATFCCAYLTGEQMLERAALKAGERVLVTGASGGVGSGIVQLARARGAIPYAVVGKGKEQAVLDIGAEAVITRGVADLPAAVNEATGGRPIDVVADLVGGAIFNDLLAHPAGPRAATRRPARSPVRWCSSISAPCISSSCNCMDRARARARDFRRIVRYIEEKKSGRWSAASTGCPISTRRKQTSSPRISSASWWWCRTRCGTGRAVSEQRPAFGRLRDARRRATVNARETRQEPALAEVGSPCPDCRSWTGSGFLPMPACRACGTGPNRFVSSAPQLVGNAWFAGGQVRVAEAHSPAKGLLCCLFHSQRHRFVTEKSDLNVLGRELTVAMTYKTVQEALRAAGIVMSKRGETHRINFFFGLEDTAHYTTSLQDALEKGLAMARRQRSVRVGPGPLASLVEPMQLSRLQNVRGSLGPGYAR